MNDINLWFQITVSILQLLFLFIGYFIAIKQFRMSKSAHYLERFLSAEITEARNTVDAVFKAQGKTKETESILNYLNQAENINDLNHIRMLANFFQELGVAYYSKLVDKKYVKDVFNYLTLNYWGTMQCWIQDYRKKDNTLYSKWETLQDDLNK